MYTDEDLNSAVKEGIFTQDAITNFRSYISKSQNVTLVDEENFRLISGFNDIFVVIACLLLLTSVAWLGSAISPIAAAIIFTATSWGLAEFFVRKRRMALPAIVLLIAFIGGVMATSVSFFVNLGIGQAQQMNIEHFEQMRVFGFITTAVVSIAATWLHWRRFRVPITVAVGAASLVICLMGLLGTSSLDSHWLTPILFISGLLIFALAMYWDASDTLRQTKRSDVAFWLHLLSAPLIVHPIFKTLGILSGHSTILQVVLVIALYIVIAFISIAIDRRALMVSSLIYVLYAFSALLKNYGLVSLNFAMTGVIIGAILLFLSAYWHTARTFLIRYFPQSISGRLPALR
ncbi:hypothetical protein [Aquirhabdus parva]|uniref:DUF2157 domain-containing protein n=1 Tax=Aquirhabdus parva TaxID=2283318 RepID=A0A345P6R4_9GAMM|nr:hypothetical protein [Aquirhabdus parva]AXI02973.1 hypothetical protein HYN46_09050 [Aquirhabdus parva]